MRKPNVSAELAAFLAGADEDERIRALHAYAQDPSGDLVDRRQELSRVLNEGTMAEVIALAGVDNAAQAKAAAVRLNEQSTPPVLEIE